MPKAKSLKRDEAKLREFRWQFVHYSRSLAEYRKMVRDKMVTYHRDDHRYYLKQWRMWKTTLQFQCTQEELHDLLKGWVVPEKYLKALFN